MILAFIWIIVIMNLFEKRIMGNLGCVVIENFWFILSVSEVVEFGDIGRSFIENIFFFFLVLLELE